MLPGNAESFPRNPHQKDQHAPSNEQTSDSSLTPRAARRSASSDAAVPQSDTENSRNALIAKCQSNLQQQLGDRRYLQWFSASRWQWNGAQLTIAVSHQIIMNWIFKQYRKSIEEISAQLTGQSVELVLMIDPTLASQNAGLTEVQLPSDNLATIKTSPAPKKAQLKVQSSSSPPKSTHAQKVHVPVAYTRVRRSVSFQDLVVGECNRLAIATAQNIAINPLDDFNTLYICGAIGTGKSALMQATYSQLMQSHPQLKILFLSAEDFGNQFSAALQSKTIASFRHKFRQIDILMVEDIDFLTSKPSFQEELLNTIRSLEQRGLKLIVSADRHPRMLPNFSEELSNRLVSGIFTKLKTPEFTTLRQIAETVSHKLNVDLSDSILDYVARKFNRSVRELQGAINSLQAHTLMNGRPLSLNAAKLALAELLRDNTKIVRLSDIESAVAEVYGIDVATMRSASRTRNVCQARMIAMYLARHLLKASYNEIGSHFGGRNHSTVVTADRKVKEWIKRKEQFPIASQLWEVTDLLANIEQQLLVA